MVKVTNLLTFDLVMPRKLKFCPNYNKSPALYLYKPALLVQETVHSDIQHITIAKKENHNFCFMVISSHLSIVIMYDCLTLFKSRTFFVY